MKQDPKGKGNHPWKGATTGAILVGTAMAALSTRRARLKERLQKLVSAKRWFVATICILSVCVLATSLLLAGQLGNYLYYRNYDLEVLRDNVAMVLQKNELFSGTIKDNLRWGNAGATDEEMIAAAKAVNVHDFIMQMEKGSFFSEASVDLCAFVVKNKKESTLSRVLFYAF